MERVNNNVARVYLVDQQQAQVPIPPHVAMQDSAGNAMPPFLHNFMITWADSFTLTVDGQPFMRLDQQRQQSIEAPSDRSSGVV